MRGQPYAQVNARKRLAAALHHWEHRAEYNHKHPDAFHRREIEIARALVAYYEECAKPAEKPPAVPLNGDER